VVSNDATAADALSTALLVLGRDGLQPLLAYHPDLGALVLAEGEAGEGYRSWSSGITVRTRSPGTMVADVA
jgi:thiamine biosynthesis lipoprotein ApbE